MSKIKIVAFGCSFLFVLLIQYLGHLHINKGYIFDIKNAIQNSLITAVIIFAVQNLLVFKPSDNN